MVSLVLHQPALRAVHGECAVQLQGCEIGDQRRMSLGTRNFTQQVKAHLQNTRLIRRTYINYVINAPVCALKFDDCIRMHMRQTK